MNTINCTEIDETVGLIAGGGLLPVEFVTHAKNIGIKNIIAVGFENCTSQDVIDNVSIYEQIGVGQLGKMIKIFKNNGAKKVLMLGSLSPKLTISNIKFDFRMVVLAAKTRDRRADSVLGAIANEMKKDDITLENTTAYLPHLLAEEGLLTKRKPGKKEWEDINFGKEIALASGNLDIGQTAIVKKHAVVAVEAMEGTDNCIKRAGELVENFIVVKMAKPNQDFRFDVPCIGPDTIKNMAEAKGAVLAIEAGKTFLLEKKETISLADKNKIAIVGCRADWMIESTN